MKERFGGRIMTDKRRTGILMPVSSLPGTLGIGDFGKDAYEWIDFMSESKASLWQILPLNPVGYGNSPYQTYSAFAGDEIYISIEDLYLSLDIEFPYKAFKSSSIDYASVREHKSAALRHAFQYFKKDGDYESFIRQAYWLEDYVLFLSRKKLNNMKSWTEWEIFDVPEIDLDYERYVQYVFFSQWMKLKDYANKKGVLIVGDIPIYLGHDSAEVYNTRNEFYLEKDGRPSLVAGVPPDFFSTEGQLWGNPLYRWDVMKENNYAFWVERLSWNQLMFDVIRIDHFRAFDTYWAIKGSADSAKEGEWIIGPRNDFFDAMYSQINNLKLVVEDLGDLRPEVLELRDDYNLMGMKIVEFALNKEDLDRDHLLDKNLLAYTGTHDNQTIAGWLEELGQAGRDDLSKNLSHMGFKDEELWQKVAHYTLSLPCNWVILPLQDILGIDNSGRINTPATIGSPNWEWKLEDYSSLSDTLLRYREWNEITNRS